MWRAFGVWAYNRTFFRMKCICFGDSICAGYGVRPEQAWVSLLAARLPAWQIINAGCNGDTTADAVRRMARDVLPLSPEVLIVAFGLNDACSRGRLWNQPAISPEEYVANMRLLVRYGQAAGAQVLVLCNHLPVPPDEYCPGFGDARHRQRTAYYNTLLRQMVAAMKEVCLVDMELALSLPPEARKCWVADDGVHLSAAGNRRYAAVLLAALAGGDDSILGKQLSGEVNPARQV